MHDDTPWFQKISRGYEWRIWEMQWSFGHNNATFACLLPIRVENGSHGGTIKWNESENGSIRTTYLRATKEHRWPQSSAHENPGQHTEACRRQDGGSSSDKNKKDKQILVSDDEGEGGKGEFTIDPYAEKMEKLQRQFEALMHRKDL